jgi:hypothetical protein
VNNPNDHILGLPCSLKTLIVSFRDCEVERCGELGDTMRYPAWRSQFVFKRCSVVRPLDMRLSLPPAMSDQKVMTLSMRALALEPPNVSLLRKFPDALGLPAQHAARPIRHQVQENHVEPKTSEVSTTEVQQ